MSHAFVKLLIIGSVPNSIFLHIMNIGAAHSLPSCTPVHLNKPTFLLHYTVLLCVSVEQGKSFHGKVTFLVLIEISQAWYPSFLEFHQKGPETSKTIVAGLFVPSHQDASSAYSLCSIGQLLHTLHLGCRLYV